MITGNVFVRRTIHIDMRNDNGNFSAQVHSDESNAVRFVISCSQQVGASEHLKKLVLLAISQALDETLNP